MRTGRFVWGMLTSGQLRWLTTGTCGLGTRRWTWLTSRIVSPAFAVKLLMSARYSRLPSSLRLNPWPTHRVSVNSRTGNDGLDTSNAVSVRPPVELTQNVLPSGENEPSWPRMPRGVLDLSTG